MQLILVDAFAHGPFTGNPAAVCLPDREVSDEWMQNLAMEMNQAETAFVQSIDGGFSLRWFTPAVEVDLCGHATLAAAHVLWETGVLKPSETARFSTKSGWLTAALHDGRITLNFPSEPPQETGEAENFAEMLGQTVVWSGRNRMDRIALLVSESAVREAKPDLARISEVDARGLIVTAPTMSDDVDFVSRFFAPQSGVPEDSVTGSAHCCLAPFWAERLGKREMVGYQASRRGGYVGVSVLGDRVALSGNATTALVGDVRCVNAQ